MAPIERLVQIDYTNWRGERRVRRIEPVGLVFGQTKWHPTPQWLLEAKDVEDQDVVKFFALTAVHDWVPIEPEGGIALNPEPCGTFGCKQPRLPKWHMCVDCWREYLDDPDAFK